MSRADSGAVEAGGFSAAPVIDQGAPATAGEATAGAPAIHTPSDRTDWLAWRRHRIGASDIAAIVGLSPWRSPWAVWLDKTTDTYLDDEPSDDQQLGLDLEDTIVRWFERRRAGLYVHARQACLVHPEHRWAGCTLDGLVVEHGTDDPTLALAVFESKKDGTAGWDEIPVHYQCQAQWAMWCTGLDVTLFAVMHLAFGHPKFRIYELTRDDASIGMLAERAERFWFDHVVAGIPPTADGSTSTSAALASAWPSPVHVPAVAVAELAPVIDELRAFKDARKQLEADIRAHENTIKAALGNHTEGVIDGQVVVSWRQQGRTDIDRDAVRAEWGSKYDTHTEMRVLRLHTPPTKRSA